MPELKDRSLSAAQQAVTKGWPTRAPFTVAGDGPPPVVVDDEPRVEVGAQSAV
jgi:hypothetical protein